ncbi:diguanylate cyclase, partial [bacterium]|nr:diguanylate cyclase [bacterium]
MSNWLEPKTVNILIADDSKIDRVLLEKTLNNWGYTVQVAQDGHEAWELLTVESAPKMAILDWVMPGYDGVELCRKIRNRSDEHYTYVLILTSKKKRTDLIEALNAGVDDYLTKPFDENELHFRIRAGQRIVELKEKLATTPSDSLEIATYDALTHLWNRHAIITCLEKELFQCRNQSRPFGLVLVDIDNLKAINQEHGYIIGDHVVRDVANRLLSSTRSYDFIGRFGGDEFLMILPDCDLVGTIQQAERVRDSVFQKPLALPGYN